MMEMWEKNKRGRKQTGCLQPPYNKSLVTKYSKLNCSSSLYFPVVVFSKIEWFCRRIILWQLSCFLESWVKHLINMNRTQHSSHWLAFHGNFGVWVLANTGNGRVCFWMLVALSLWACKSQVIQQKLPRLPDSSLPAVKSSTGGIWGTSATLSCA